MMNPKRIEDKNGFSFPMIVDGKFHPDISKMLCQEITFEICLGHNSTIRGKGSIVFGAGGNTDELMIFVDDREIGRLSDMRFRVKDIENNIKGFIIRMTNKEWW